jgi:hypothetical protein
MRGGGFARILLRGMKIRLRWAGCVAAATLVPLTLAVPAPAATPAQSLHRIANRHHAKFVVGPVRGHGHLFGAYSVIRSVYCCRDPHNVLHVLRWQHGRWNTDGTLRAAEQTLASTTTWNFPDTSLYARHIDGASDEAPVFGGAVNGTYPSAHMLAVRTHAWHWATFVQCRRLAGCSQPTVRSTVVLNPRVSHGRLTSRVGSCRPSCGAPHQVVYVIRFAWHATDHAFVEVGVRRTTS